MEKKSQKYHLFKRGLLFVQAIIPAKPDVWVWMGDLAYMDIPAVDCYSKENHEHPDCNCSPTVLRHPSHGCKSGDEQNARRKANAITHSAGVHSSSTGCRTPHSYLNTARKSPIFAVKSRKGMSHK